MRIHSLLLLAPLAASCTMATPVSMAAPTPQEQAKFASLTAGKVAGPPVSCLPTYRSNDMIVIDENTIAFRQGAGRVFINHMDGGCMNIRGGSNTLVTRTTGSSLCRGDIAQVVDRLSSIPVGSCVFGDFTPYTRVHS